MELARRVLGMHAGDDLRLFEVGVGLSGGERDV